MLEIESNPAFPYTHAEIPIPVQNLLFPNESWIEVEKERASNFLTFESLNDITKHIIQSDDQSNRVLISKKIKKLIRFGIPSNLRFKYWLLLSGGQHLLDEGFDYYDIIQTLINTNNFKKQITMPFGVPIDFIEAYSGGNQRIIDFIYIVAYQNQNIQYAPFIPRVCLILLTFLKNNNDAYVAIQAMINQNQNDWYFATSFENFLVSSMSIRELCQSKVPKLYRHLLSLQIDVSQLFLLFMFDKDYLTTPITLTLFDSYMNEGMKVLIRFFFTFLIQETKAILKCKTTDEIHNVFSAFYQSLDENAYLVNDFLSKSFTFNLSRSRHIFKSENSVKKKKKEFESISSHLSSGSIPKPPLKGNFGSLGANGASYSRSTIDINSFFQFDIDEQLQICNSCPPDFQISESQPTSFSSPDDTPIEEEEQLSTATQSNGSSSLSSFKQHLFSYNYSSLIYSMENPTLKIRTNSSTIIKRLPFDMNNEGLDSSLLLTKEIFDQIRCEFPSYWKSSSPLLEYKLSKDGASFKTFQSSITNTSPHTLLIKTNEYIVGAYLSDPPTNHSVSLNGTDGIRRHNSLLGSDSSNDSRFSRSRYSMRKTGKYFGSMSTFVFQINQNNKIDFYKPVTEENSTKCVNSFFISVDNDSLMIGGPMAAIYIEKYFTHLLSSQCETFGSPQFTFNNNGDKMLDVELYALKQ